MKTLVCLFTIISVGSLLAQSPGRPGATSSRPQPGASTGRPQPRPSVSGGAAVQRPLSGTIPAQTAPVTGVLTPEAVNAGSTTIATGTGFTPISPEVVAPLNNQIAPPISLTTPPNVIPQDVTPIDPARTSIQGTLGTGSANTLTGARQVANRIDQEGFSQQLNLATGQNGASQISFPEQNAIVTIISQDGNLTLQGAVSSEAQRRQIEDTIDDISNAGFINNQIQVLPGLDPNSVPPTLFTAP